MSELEDYGDPLLAQANRALYARAILAAERAMVAKMARGVLCERPSPEFLCLVADARRNLIEMERMTE